MLDIEGENPVEQGERMSNLALVTTVSDSALRSGGDGVTPGISLINALEMWRGSRLEVRGLLADSTCPNKLLQKTGCSRRAHSRRLARICAR